VVSRPWYTQGSVFQKKIFEKLVFGDRVSKLIEAFQKRTEFKDALSQHEMHKIYLEAVSKTPAGTKVPFWLPMP
jgi:hypothetical protein